jgi:hypothetical protein
MAWLSKFRYWTTTSSPESSVESEFNERIAFQKLLDEEAQAVNDHELALHLAGLSTSDSGHASRAEYKAQLAAASTCNDTTQPETANHQYEPGVDLVRDLYKSTLRTAKRLYASAFGESTIQPASSETDSAHCQDIAFEPTDPESVGSENLAKCNVCMEVTSPENTLHLQCEHIYCHACLVTLYTSAVADATLFPPRCCKLPIPLDTCRMVLPKGLIKEFDLKVEELATPNPTYCANAHCAKFIRPGKIVSDVASCVFCKEKTCVRCKSQSHEGLCPSDPHVKLLIDVAKRSKWQKCSNCNNMVELSQGCFHMT